LKRLKNVEADVADPAGCKVGSINRNAAQLAAPADLVVLAADDFVPQQKGWDERIATDYAELKPDGNGYALWYRDGLQTGDEDKICTIPVLSASIVQRWGFIYHPAYKSVFCDNEYTDVLLTANRLRRIPKVLFKHDWSMSDVGGKPDPLKARNESRELYATDEITYKKRKADGFPGTADIFTDPKKSKRKPKASDDPLDILAGGPDIIVAAPPAKVLATVNLPRMSVILQPGPNVEAHASVREIFLAASKEYQFQVIESASRREAVRVSTGSYLVFIPTSAWRVHREFGQMVSSFFNGTPDAIGIVAEGVPANVNPAVMSKAESAMALNMTPCAFSFSNLYPIPGRRENGTLAIVYHWYTTLLCPTRHEIIRQYDESAGLLDDQENPGGENDLRRWCGILSAAKAIKVENPMKQSVYQQI
jgi:hypothetical protein